MGIEQFGKLNSAAMVRELINARTPLAVSSVAPTNGINGTGAGLFGKGTLLITQDDGGLWSQIGTIESPIWREHVGSTAVGISGSNCQALGTNENEAAVQLLHRVSISGASTISLTLTINEEVNDVWLVIDTPDVSGTVTINKNVTSAITNAMSLNGSIDDIVRANTINGPFAQIPSGQTMDIVVANGGAATVWISSYRLVLE